MNRGLKPLLNVKHAAIGGHRTRWNRGSCVDE